MENRDYFPSPRTSSPTSGGNHYSTERVSVGYTSEKQLRGRPPRPITQQSVKHCQEDFPEKYEIDRRDHRKVSSHEGCVDNIVENRDYVHS